MSKSEEAIYARIDRSILEAAQRLDAIREWAHKDTEQAAIEAQELSSVAGTLESLFDALMRIQVNQ